MGTEPRDGHILDEIELPSRYERLAEILGSEVTKVLVRPEEDTAETFERTAVGIEKRGEGVLAPLIGQSGTGKTTLANNLTHFFPDSYAPTATFEGEITFNRLRVRAEDILDDLSADEDRILPVNIEHRERSPPTPEELSAVKRFVRTDEFESKPLVLWPTTDSDVANEISEKFEGTAGAAPIDLPIDASGPNQETWPEIAKTTLKLVNNLPSLERLGVNPDDYPPSSYSSIGAYLRALSDNLSDLLYKLKKETDKKLSLTIVFVTKSRDFGVLSELTNSTRYGYLDGHALVEVTPESEVGGWWKDRQSLLTRTIVGMNAHALALPPAPAVEALINFDNGSVRETIEKAGRTRRGPSEARRYIARSDLGKHLSGETVTSFEARGNPAESATNAFRKLAEEEFTGGADKELNQIMARAIENFLEEEEIPFNEVTHEKQLEFCSLIPDNAIHKEDQVECVEYTWRSSLTLETTYRSEIAQYILGKLRDYARELGWTSD